jgi:hypothetical protein
MLFHANPKTRFPLGDARIPVHYAHFPEPFVVFPHPVWIAEETKRGSFFLVKTGERPRINPASSTNPNCARVGCLVALWRFEGSA